MDYEMEQSLAIKLYARSEKDIDSLTDVQLEV